MLSKIPHPLPPVPPPYHCELLPYRRVLVLAPHPDDEVFGCGGSLALLLQAGASLLVLILTDGAAGGVLDLAETSGHDKAQGLAALRIEESRKAALALGMNPSALDPSLQALGFPDGQLSAVQAASEAVLARWLSFQPDAVFAPAPTEAHPDHQAAAAIATHCLQIAQQQNLPSDLLFYEVGQPLRPNCLVDISKVMQRKLEAMRCFKTQLADRPYDDLIQSLNRFRSYTVSHQAQFVEGFFRQQSMPSDSAATPANDSPRIEDSSRIEAQPSPALALPFQSTTHPAVAVVVRTQWRPSLEQSLQSLAKQHGVDLWVVLVWVSHDDKRANQMLSPWREALKIRHCGLFADERKVSGAILSRADAINAGLEAALQLPVSYIGFLDDDDRLDPNHVQGLARILEDDTTLIAAYGGVRLLDNAGQSHKTLHEEWDPQRLLRANFLPIHAVLFRRSLVEDYAPNGQPLRADPQFDLYEDWDFWLQASERGHFLRASQISADYVQHEQSMASGVAQEAQRQAARLAIYRKWIAPKHLARIASAFRVDELDLQKARQQGLDAKAHIDLLKAELQSRQTAQAEERLQWDAAFAQAREHMLVLERSIFDKDTNINTLNELVVELQADQQSLMATKAELNQAQAALNDAKSALQAHAQALADSKAALQQQAEVIQTLQAEATNTESQLHREHDERVQLDQEVRRLHLEVAAREQSIERMRQSLSWRLSLPIRALGNISRRLALSAYPLARSIAKPLARAIGIPHPRVWWRSKFAASAAQGDFGRSPGDASRSQGSLLQGLAGKDAFKAKAQKDLEQWLAQDERIDISVLKKGGTLVDPGRCVSIILVLFNQAGLTKRCLDSILAHARLHEHSASIELIIADNASSDLTSALLERIDGATLIRNEENLGFIRAVNRASDQASGDYLLFLNNDAELLPGCIDAALSRMQSDPSIQAVGGPVLLLDGSLQEAGNIIWSDASCLGYGRGESPDADKFQHSRNVDYVSGAFLLTPLVRFRAMCKFDERFAPAYYEESDYCARLWQAGFRVVYEPQARIRHFEFASSSSSSWAIAQQQKNKDHFQRKHSEWLKQQATLDPLAWQAGSARVREGALRKAALLACSRPARAGMKPARILVLDDRVPHRDLGSGFPRSRDMLIEMADAGHQVCLLPVTFPNDNWQAIRKTLPVQIEVALNIGAAGLNAFLLERRSWITHLLVSRPHNMSFLRPVWDQHREMFDRWHKVYDAEAIFTYRDAELAKLRGEPMSDSQCLRSLEAELDLARGVDAITAVSVNEAKTFRKLLKVPTEVVGHLLHASPSTTAFEDRKGILFVGALFEDNTPNTESMVWFIDEVLPRLNARLGPREGIKLDLVGRCQAPAILNRKSESIRIHGPVDALQPYFEQARLFVVPTRYAAGIPHKAHEAASRGLPMVVTSLIARQLGWDHNTVRIADQADEFAHACASLIEDKGSWTRLRDTAIDRIKSDCDPELFRRSLFKAMHLN